jgi:hypothetical protein
MGARIVNVMKTCEKKALQKHISWEEIKGEKEDYSPHGNRWANDCFIWLYRI